MSLPQSEASPSLAIMQMHDIKGNDIILRRVNKEELHSKVNTGDFSLLVCQQIITGEGQARSQTSSSSSGPAVPVELNQSGAAVIGGQVFVFVRIRQRTEKMRRINKCVTLTGMNRDRRLS